MQEQVNHARIMEYKMKEMAEIKAFKYIFNGNDDKSHQHESILKRGHLY